MTFAGRVLSSGKGAPFVILAVSLLLPPLLAESRGLFISSAALLALLAGSLPDPPGRLLAR